MHEPQQCTTLCKGINRERSYVKKMGVSVDKCEIFQKNTYFGSFNKFFWIQLRYITFKCQNPVDDGRGYTLQQHGRIQWG